MQKAPIYTGCQSAGQSIIPWARMWGSVFIFRRGFASKQVWETVA